VDVDHTTLDKVWGDGTGRRFEFICDPTNIEVVSAGTFSHGVTNADWVGKHKPMALVKNLKMKREPPRKKRRSKRETFVCLFHGHIVRFTE